MCQGAQLKNRFNRSIIEAIEPVRKAGFEIALNWKKYSLPIGALRGKGRGIGPPLSRQESILVCIPVQIPGVRKLLGLNLRFSQGLMVARPIEVDDVTFSWVL